MLLTGTPFMKIGCTKRGADHVSQYASSGQVRAKESSSALNLATTPAAISRPVAKTAVENQLTGNMLQRKHGVYEGPSRYVSLVIPTISTVNTGW